MVKPSSRTNSPAAAPVPSAGRLFLAVPLTPEAREAIRRHLDQHLQSRPLPGRVVAPENWHLTLRFLGETAPSALTELRGRLGATPWPPAFALTFGTLGAFPREDRARVVWLGVDHDADEGQGAEAVGRFAALAEEAATGAGFAPERRPFNSHLTLSRLDPPADVRRVISAVPSLGLTMLVSEVVLIRSHLGRGPAEYERVARWGLVGG